MKEPLSNDDAKREIVRRFKAGPGRLTTHFNRACLADGVIPSQSAELVVAGIVEFSEFENGEWRYRVRNGRSVVVVSFRSDGRLDFVTYFGKS